MVRWVATVVSMGLERVERMVEGTVPEVVSAVVATVVVSVEVVVGEMEVKWGASVEGGGVRAGETLAVAVLRVQKGGTV